MKKNILLLLGILLTTSLMAQKVQISNPNIREHSDQVTISFTAKLDKLSSNEKLIVTPVLYNKGGEKELSSIVVAGRNRLISDKRMGYPAGTKSTDSLSMPYSVTIPYENWMGEVSMRLNRTVEDCCNLQQLPIQGVFSNQLIRYDVILPPIDSIEAELTATQKLGLNNPFLRPMDEYSPASVNFDAPRAAGAQIIRFKQGKVVIDRNYLANKQALEVVKSVVDLVLQDPYASLGKVVLAGGSSPEGLATLNDRVSLQRVTALKQTLCDDVDVQDDLFEIINLGEDWVGLRQMIASSTMAHKESVLDIIDTYSVQQGREVKLMKLKRGVPYKYMAKHFFPLLRNAGYIRVYYNTKATPDFEQTNKAIGHYNIKAYAAALDCLEDVKSTAITENIKGVCVMMAGDYSKAEQHYEKAIALGSEQAVINLQQLIKLKSIER